MSHLPKHKWIKGWPTCPTCGSRFQQQEGEGYAKCPDCREDDLTYDDRLAIGFSMTEPDEGNDDEQHHPNNIQERPRY